MDHNTDTVIENFFDKFKSLNFDKKQLILNAEDQPQGVYYLKEGYVRMYTITQDGYELTLNILKPKTFFPLTWAISDIDNAYFYEALTKCRLNIASKNKTVDFIKGNKEILFDIVRRVITGLDSTLIRLQYLTIGNAYQRVTSSLLMLAARFGEIIGDYIKLSINFTEQDIANLAGVTRETVSIELSKLKNQGYIKRKEGLYFIYNIDQLREESLIYYEGKALPYTF